MATARPKGKGYEIRASLGYDINGKKISPSFTWVPEPKMTPKQIEKELARQKFLFDEKVRSGQYLDGKIKLHDFAGKWFSDYAEKNCKKKTVARYKVLMERIDTALGHLQLEKLHPHHLLEFYKNLQEGGVRGDGKFKPIDGFDKILQEKHLTHLKVADTAGVSISVLKSCSASRNVTAGSAKKVAKALNMDTVKLFTAVAPNDNLAANTVLYYHRLLSSMFSTAVKWQIIFSNPCSRVDPPKAERSEAKYLDEHEASKLLELIDAEPIQFRTMVKLLIFTGMRRGELCGLEWGDIDFVNRTIHIQRNSLYLPGEGIFVDTTKNCSSDRVIKISLTAIELLKSYLKWQTEYMRELGDQWIDTDRLFTTWNGTPIFPDTVTSRFSEFVKDTDLPDITIHSLRHTNATLMIAGGTSLATVQKRLGHAQQTTTANIYAHAIRSADEIAAETLEDILKPAKPQKVNKEA